MVSVAEILTSQVTPEEFTHEQLRAKGRLIDNLFANVYDRFTDNSIEHTFSQDSRTGTQLQTVYFFSENLNGLISIVNVPTPHKAKEELLLSLDFKKSDEGTVKIKLRIGGNDETARINHDALLSGYSAAQLATIVDLVKTARPSTPEEYSYHFPQST